jgi:hypothetical protein
MTTKQEVADHINALIPKNVLTEGEKAYIQGKMDPYFAHCLIKIVGDVSWLVAIRDNASKDDEWFNPDRA